jgi:hypothetical protein
VLAEESDHLGIEILTGGHAVENPASRCRVRVALRLLRRTRRDKGEVSGIWRDMIIGVRRQVSQKAAASAQRRAPISALGLPYLALGATTALGHELIEFCLVFGVPQPVEELLEFALFLLEPAESLSAVFVKGAVAAGG